jgi:hypothetical protein
LKTPIITPFCRAALPFRHLFSRPALHLQVDQSVRKRKNLLASEQPYPTAEGGDAAMCAGGWTGVAMGVGDFYMTDPKVVRSADANYRPGFSQR